MTITSRFGVIFEVNAGSSAFSISKVENEAL